MYITSPGTLFSGIIIVIILYGLNRSGQVLQVLYGWFTALRTRFELYGLYYRFYERGMQLFLALAICCVVLGPDLPVAQTIVHCDGTPILALHTIFIHIQQGSIIFRSGEFPG